MYKENTIKNTNIYDVIVIGAGAGGLNTASFLSQIKLKVLLIDKNASSIGGECLWSGCVPSKALIHFAKNYSSQSAYTIHDIKKYITDIQEKIKEHENEDYIKKNGIDFLMGEARFVNKNSISINSQIYTAKKIIIATGSRPKKLNIQNDNTIPLYNNENIFDFNFTDSKIPKKFIFIGAGPISLELGLAFHNLGSEVTIINGADRILSKESEHISKKLEKNLLDKHNKLKIYNNANLKKIENKKIYFEVKNHDSFELECDAVFVGVGRDLNIENLDLEKASIELNKEKNKIICNEYLETTNNNVLLCGDVAGNYQFTHATEMHAKVILHNMFSPVKSKFDDRYISWTTFTNPEITSFGVNYEKATKENYEILCLDFVHDDMAIISHDASGYMEVYLSDDAKIMGGTIISNHADSIASEILLAMTNNIALPQIFEKVYPYPSHSRIIRTLAQKYSKRKLTNRNKLYLRVLFYLKNLF
jgi:pyruvate/2-oxoglutarate dehydrogenase complex dihydrolipoamide dehydrogenase (E3) component